LSDGNEQRGMDHGKLQRAGPSKIIQRTIID
jgi:hypothetical protein